MSSHAAAADPPDAGPQRTAAGLTPAQSRWLEPLEHFLPGFVGQSDWQWLDPGQLPSAPRRLLAHDDDMTPTLERFHGAAIDLEVRALEQHGDRLSRLVILHEHHGGKPVEFGAIWIHLDGFEPHVRRAIEAGGEPLGGILGRLCVPHSSHPRAFFSCNAGVVARRLGGFELMPGQPPPASYGRCNELRHADGRVFAEIVEILPPLPAEPTLCGDRQIGG